MAVPRGDLETRPGLDLDQAQAVPGTVSPRLDLRLASALYPNPERGGPGVYECILQRGKWLSVLASFELTLTVRSSIPLGCEVPGNTASFQAPYNKVPLYL